MIRDEEGDAKDGNIGDADFGGDCRVQLWSCHVEEPTG